MKKFYMALGMLTSTALFAGMPNPTPDLANQGYANSTLSSHSTFGSTLNLDTATPPSSNLAAETIAPSDILLIMEKLEQIQTLLADNQQKHESCKNERKTHYAKEKMQYQQTLEAIKTSLDAIKQRLGIAN